MIGKGFLPGSLVTMSDGTLKPIERVSKKDMVLSGSGAPDSVESIYSFRYVGNTKSIHAKGMAELLKIHPFQGIYSLNGRSWKATCNKWLWPVSDADLVNSLDFRHEIKLSPIPAVDIERGDRLTRVVYPTVLRNMMPENDSAFLLGTYAARGQSDKNNIVLKFRSSDVYSLERAEKLFNNWHIVYKLKHDKDIDSINIIANCDWLIKWIKIYVLENGIERSLTPQMMAMDHEKQISFLSGYFGDSTELFCGERSFKLVNQVQMIMDRNHLHSSTHKGFKFTTKEGAKIGTYNLRTTPFYAQKIASTPELIEKIKLPGKNHKFSWFIGNKVFIPTGRVTNTTYDGYLYFINLEIEKSYVVNGVVVAS